MPQAASVSTVGFEADAKTITASISVLPARARTVGQAVAALTPEERRAREEAVRFADASIGLEGFTVSPAAKIRAERFINGEIDLAEFVRGV